ncbi:MAG: peptidoglycan-binding domain-containing protein [Candidatus Paceibacterota bacterium]
MSIKKTMLVVAGLAVAFAFVAVPANAQTTEELQQEIAALVAMIESLQAQIAGGTTAPGTDIGVTSFNQNLSIGSTGPEVLALQKFLNSKGYTVATSGAGSPGNESSYFGSLTQSALIQFQSANGITMAQGAGNFGPLTRAIINPMLASLPTTIPGTVTGDDGDDDTTTTITLEGGAGSINDVDWVSSYNNEEVGEGESDKKVAGLDIEASKGSDISIVAATIDFDAVSGVGTNDLDDYADEVSFWFDGKEIARVDAREFEDDDDFVRTVTFDAGAIIKSGQKGRLIIAVSGLSNIDSTDLTDSWNVSVRSLRFVDAQGAVITESSIGDLESTPDNNTTTDSDEKQFSFESFATSADIELKIREDDSSINDSQTLEADDTTNTDDVQVLSFTMEAEGNSDLLIDDITADFTSVGAGVGEIINYSNIIIDGVSYSASSTIASTTATTMTVTYDNMDFVLRAGDIVNVTIEVDVNNLDGGFTAGDTLAVDVNPNDSGWDVEDEEGDAVGSGDKSGTATSDAHSFFDDGVNIVFVSPSVETIKDTNGDTAGGEQGQYTIKVEVTAFGDTIYIPFGATTATSSVTAAKGIAYAIENSDGDQIALNGAGLASTTAVVSSSANTEVAGGVSYYKVTDGSTETFTLQVTLTPLADGFFRTQFDAVNFNVGTAAAADTHNDATPASGFDSDYLNLDV